MDISNALSLKVASYKVDGLAPADSISGLSKDAKPNETKSEGVKQATELIPKTESVPTEPNSNRDELKRISEKLQSMFNSDLIFSIDERSGEHVIQVIDKSTKEVIRQIPSEEAIQIKESIDRFQKGLLVNIKT
ncbi:flagellar protein FlaG [Methylomonas methanica]|uniref:Flagellar protein FlaG protein n=1 Tax=Methylomonas methanica (strain DSM 25384 / MC09) TaxID=857087 RepID=F9ZZE3_METMM|nr:flagellar protein FlaG [Methylomonas methanica]AEG02336.1 flagellar protein FlaG protein [Methylomonas methanica MC09]